MTREPIGAEHETIGDSQILDEDIGLHAAWIADESRDAGGDRTAVIVGELARRARAHQIRAAVPEVRDDDAILPHECRDERARGLRKIRGLRGAQHGRVRVAHRIGQPVRDRPCVSALKDALCKLGHGGVRRDLATWRATDAVGYRKKERAAVLADDVAILVPLPQAPDIASRRRLLQPPSPLRQSLPGTYQREAVLPRVNDAPAAGSCRATLHAAALAPLSPS